MEYKYTGTTVHYNTDHIPCHIRNRDGNCVKLGKFNLYDLVKVKKSAENKYSYRFSNTPLTIIYLDDRDTDGQEIKCCITSKTNNEIYKENWFWANRKDLEIVKRFDPKDQINKLVKKIKKIETENNKNNK